MSVRVRLSPLKIVSVAKLVRQWPAKPLASADVTVTTHGKVNVIATFSDDSAIKEYKAERMAVRKICDSDVSQKDKLKAVLDLMGEN